jgi:type IV pilus assembly protein PilM
MDLLKFGARKKDRDEFSVCLTCDVDGQKLTFAEVESVADQYCVRNIEQIVRPAAPPPGTPIAELLHSAGFTSKQLRLNVRGYGVISRFIQFPQMKQTDIRSALAFEAEKFLPFKLNEVVLDYCILDPDVPMGAGNRGMNLMLVAIKKEEICPLLEMLRDAQYELELVATNSVSLLNALEYFVPESLKTCVGVLDVSSTVSTLTIAKDGKPRFVRDISVGEIDISKRLKVIMGMNDAKVSEIMTSGDAKGVDLLPPMKEALKGLIADIKISLSYFTNQTHSQEALDKLYLAGRFTHPILSQTLGNALNLSVLQWDLGEKISVAPSVTAEKKSKFLGLFPLFMGAVVRNL